MASAMGPVESPDVAMNVRSVVLLWRTKKIYPVRLRRTLSELGGFDPKAYSSQCPTFNSVQLSRVQRSNKKSPFGRVLHRSNGGSSTLHDLRTLDGLSL